ncbi:hypothetical protein BS50DRAFT_575528 [Corynespora cassiicola Philippines]|uniref:Uncharacterized protein n=1 Tax=Corynespora cassiicola Philippines TaxID=1448308 RepID=A0A2T2NJE4_CORCC|nr:hypothetical protein BS50DRAFT_575528 [Corynespora cassiicola Philippines]
MSYNQPPPPPGYQRPGSTTSFTAQAPPPPPPYGANTGYQSATPQNQSQWTAPPPPAQQWNQSQPQNAGGYNPSTYGAMPGAYTQGQQPPTNQPSNPYAAQQQDVPPPPPPKPHGFAAAVHQQQQQQQQQNQPNWGQEQGYGNQSQQGFQASAQPNTGYPQQAQQGGYPTQTQGVQQQYNNTAPPPPSQTPGGSYFPPSQGRPQSLYGADQAGTYSTPSSAVAQHPPNTVLSPNEQQPAYIPPSLTGQGVQSYMPANTNPMPGVYVPPPPDIPAWQQAQHAPLQGGSKKFRYTKPSVDPSFYAQGYQGLQPQPQPQPQPQGQTGFGQPQAQFSQQPSQQQPQQQGQFGQASQGQFQTQLPHQQGQYGQPQQGQYAQPPSHDQFQQQPQLSQFPQPAQGQQQHKYPQQQNQWQPTPPVDQGYTQEQQITQAPYSNQQPAPSQGWQPTHQTQGSIASQQYPQGQGQPIQAPQPVSGHTGTTPPGFVSEPSPQSQPVSPMQNRHSMSFASGHTSSLGRTSSVSSIALGALHAQRAGNKTASPKPTLANVPQPPPRDDASRFSALGTGGPSDWEHFGNVEEEVDDEAYFGAKKEEKNQPAQLDSVELPAQIPSPPSAQGEWPSPPTQPAPLSIGSQRDTYQPTPPPKPATPARPYSQPPEQSFVMSDAITAPPVSHSPQPIQSSQAPPPQQGFVMDDGSWPASSQERQQTPSQFQQQQQPPSQTGPIMNQESWGISQQAQANASADWNSQQNLNHAAELKAKDDAYERLKADADKEKAVLHGEIESARKELHTEIEKVKKDLEDARAHAAGEKNVLMEQLEAMKIAADQATTNAEALDKEKDSLIERIKEDAEGKDDVIKANEATIADLKRQLEVEKEKEVPKPTSFDLLPDIDPWYVSSLERYIAMLRSEASELQVEGKIKIFTDFLRAESGIRGVDYFSAPPPAPPTTESIVHQRSEQRAPISPTTSPGKQDLNIQVPQDSPSQDDFQYSPGGRPILLSKPLVSTDTVPTQRSFATPVNEHPPPISTASTMILTPTSSVDDDMKTPIQSPPEEPAQSQYKAYVPPSVGQTDSAHRQSVSFASVPSVAPLQIGGASKNNDEIFFGAHNAQKTAPPVSRLTSTDSVISDVPIPAPLSFTPQPASKPAAPKKNPLDALAELLPRQLNDPKPSPKLEEIRKKAQAAPVDFAHIQELTTSWEKSASLSRRKNEDARRKRQEENEAENNQLFEANEISYAEIGDLEDEFKEKERELKAKEDREEYKTYVENVFDKVYDGLQADIKSLMDLYMEVEIMLGASISGIKSLYLGNHEKEPDVYTTRECLELLKSLHDMIELRHEKVVQAVAERDKRYKKTEVQPLYAAGNITKMKTVERHFENAEKQAVVRAMSEKEERAGELVRVAEDVVVHAVAIEQEDIERVLSAIRNMGPEIPDGKADVLKKAHETLQRLRASSKSLLELFNTFEIELNNSVMEVEIAQARAENADSDKIVQLEREFKAGEAKLNEELQRKLGVIEQDGEEIKALVKQKGGEVELSEEEIKEARMKKALEEAKRRNGEL